MLYTKIRYILNCVREVVSVFKVDTKGSEVIFNLPGPRATRLLWYSE